MTNPAYPDALPALARLHWYVVERVLGQGGFGITYLARDTNLDQAVAIKEYLPVDVATRMPDATIRSRSDDLRDRYRWGLERFIQEARTLARFDHPNIVRVHSVFEFNNTAYMVMRLEKGATLAALLDRRGTLPESELLRTMLPILSGLELVHNAGFIHRDIKPDNIHIRDDHNPVLLDFGSARQALGNSHTLTILVAPGYAPFEQYYSDSANQGPWTDIYSLGATCYRAIAGRPPLDAISRSKGILGSTQDVLVPASIIGAGRYSGAFLAAIDHALAFAERDRPQSIAQWRQALEAGNALPSVPVQATPAHWTPPPSIATATPSTALTATPTRTLTTITAPENPLAPPPHAIAAEMRKPGGARQTLVVALLGVAIGAASVLAYVVATQRSSAPVPPEEKSQSSNGNISQPSPPDKDVLADNAKSTTTEEPKPAPDTKPVPSQQPPAKTETKPRVATPNGPISAPKDQRASPKTTPSPKDSGADAKKPPVEEPVSAPAPAPQQPPKIEPEPKVPPPAPAPPTPPAQLAEAERAIEAKRYADALTILNPLAEAGNRRAQMLLGGLYENGLGVKRDYDAAVRWYEKAEDQGDDVAAFRLGALYEGAKRNNSLAYIWYGMAAALGSTAGKAAQERVAAPLQPAQREQLDRQIRDMRKP